MKQNVFLHWSVAPLRACFATARRAGKCEREIPVINKESSVNGWFSFSRQIFNCHKICKDREAKKKTCDWKGLKLWKRKFWLRLSNRAPTSSFSTACSGSRIWNFEQERTTFRTLSQFSFSVKWWVSSQRAQINKVLSWRIQNFTFYWWSRSKL